MVDTLLCALQNEVNIMGVALLGACDVFQSGGRDDRHLGFYSNLEIFKNGGNRKVIMLDIPRACTSEG